MLVLLWVVVLMLVLVLFVDRGLGLRFAIGTGLGALDELVSLLV